jgi:exonuclease VII small subunit
MATAEAQGFSAHYLRLQQSVERLRGLDVADLDELLTLVDAASGAYKGCQQRIEAVRTLLDQRLGGTEEGGG